jgi:hypothetical protein
MSAKQPTNDLKAEFGRRVASRNMERLAQFVIVFHPDINWLDYVEALEPADRKWARKTLLHLQSDPTA